MKITVHIGATKTGTSALQSHLYLARAKLSQAGILYPDIGVVSNAHHLLFAAVHPSAWHLHRDDLPGQEAERIAFFDTLLDQIFEAQSYLKARHIVLSSEYLWGVLPSRIADRVHQRFKGHDVRLIAAVRRQDMWLEASYLQAVKFGVRKSFEEWREEFQKRPVSGFDYGNVLKSWEEILEPIETHFVAYKFVDRTKYTKAMVDLICDTKISSKVVPRKAVTINPSPTLDGLQALLGGDRSEKPNMWRSEGSYAAMLLSPEEQLQLLSENREINKTLARRFAPNGPEEFFDMSDLPTVPSKTV